MLSECIAYIALSMEGSAYVNIEHMRAQYRLDEGYRNEIYKDYLGHKTFGLGHLVTKDDPEFNAPVGTKVSPYRINEAFVCDVAESIAENKKLYPFWSELPIQAQEVLINMMFNIGRTKLSKFTEMNKAVAQQDWQVAALEGRDSLWYTQVGSRAERLMGRLDGLVE